MKLQQLVEKAAEIRKTTVAVAAADDMEVLEAVVQAVKMNIADFLLFGNKNQINDYLETISQGISKNSSVRVYHAHSAQSSAELAVKAVHRNDAEVLMKGNVPTAVILKAVLNKDYGLRTSSVLSHVAMFEISGYDRLIFVSDAAMNIAPDLSQKVQILQNTVAVARSLNVRNPKVACLAAIETVNPAMSATMDAAILSQMNTRGQIKDCIVDGPLSLDVSISPIAARHKGIESDVAGVADVLLVPSIEVGNVLYKSLVYFSNAKVAAIIAGAKAPIILTSRADSAESKLYSLAMAICSTSLNE